MTPKEQLWKEYHAAVKAGNNTLAQEILKKIHAAPRSVNRAPSRTGGCSRCRKRF